MGDVLTPQPSVAFIPVWSGSPGPCHGPSLSCPRSPWTEPDDGETGTQVRLRSISRVGRAMRGRYTCGSPLVPADAGAGSALWSPCGLEAEAIIGGGGCRPVAKAFCPSGDLALIYPSPLTTWGRGCVVRHPELSEDASTTVQENGAPNGCSFRM